MMTITIHADVAFAEALRAHALSPKKSSSPEDAPDNMKAIRRETSYDL